MGSLSSTPKVPARQVVYAPAPSATISTPKAVSEPVKSPASVDASRAREKTLLARKRGRAGTIATSLQGFLGSANKSARKTLLGE